MKIYILLIWYWDECQSLINNYIKTFRTLTGAVKEGKKLCGYRRKPRELYLPDDDIPKEEDGNYHSDPFYQIIREFL